MALMGAQDNQIINDSLDDSSIFISSYVPLMLRLKSRPSNLIWYNIKSSYSRYCRLIRMRFAKETKELTEPEKERLADEMKRLTTTQCQDRSSHNQSAHLALTQHD